MVPLTIGEAAAACGGRVEHADPRTTLTGVSIDSRVVRPGDLFVALPGRHTDGHVFAGDAVARGAAAVLVRAGAEGTPAIRVADPLAALAAVAGAVRGGSRATVVAITGSNGKTTTKHLTAAAVASCRRVVASYGSYNNEIGVPLTICSLELDSEVLVSEIGSRGRGHIAAMVPVLRPHLGVVTNVGRAHLELFGSLDGIALAKAELVESLPTGGTAVLNADDERVAAMAARTRAAVVTFGTSSGADVRGESIELDAGALARFEVAIGGDRAKVALQIPGEHMVGNALAALAVATLLDVPLDAAAAAVSDAPAPAWRMEVRDSHLGFTVVNDAYNANPTSAAAALRALAAMSGGRRSWAVLGEMAELGPEAGREQDRLGRLAVRLGIRRLIAVGEGARPACEAARLEGMSPEEAVSVADVEAAALLILARAEPGDVVLLKGSRVAGLERIAGILGIGEP